MKQFNRWIRSKSGIASIAGAVILALVVAFLGQQFGWWGGPGTAGLPAVPKAEFPAPAGGFTCLPSCEVDDGKFLTLVNDSMRSLGGVKLVTWVAVPGNLQSFQLSIFDGDSGKDNNGNVNFKAGNWDNTQTEATYTIYADPMKDGTGMQVVGVWRGNQDPMPNNGWFDINLENQASAKAPSGHFFYRLEAEQPPQGSGLNAFKLRSSGYLIAGRFEQAKFPIGIIGMIYGYNDAYILYPQFQSLSNPGPSNYIGEWSFSFYVPSDQTLLEIWDGDFDRGTSATVDEDTADFNTEGKPEWANEFAVPERAGGKGAPADDNWSFPLYLRSPAVLYKLIDPDGAPIYVNEEPSGTEEWERFVMSTDPSQQPDLLVDKIKPGFYIIHIEGLDLFNAVWLATDYEICDPVSGCGPCVWPGCDNTACPRTIGYWKNNVGKVLIEKRTRGVQESPESLNWALQNVATASPLFRTGINIAAPSAIANPVRLTDDEAYQILMRGANAPYPADKNTMLARALQQNLAAWLNLASGKVSDNTVVTLNVAGGPFNGTIWEALQEAQEIILTNDTARMERAKDIGDQINNGLLGEEVEVGSCDAGTGDSKDYEKTMPKDKQPPKHKDMPKAPKPETPKQVTPGPEPVCSANNTYKVENPTNNPFYGIKFEFQSGVDVRDGSYDHFEVTLPADVVQGMTSIQLEAKSATNTSIVTLEADFTSPFGGGEPIASESGLHGFAFMGAVDNGDGTYTLSFKVVVYDTQALSHVTIGLPAGAVPSESGSYTSESCVAP
jgi:hypothetical protein